MSRRHAALSTTASAVSARETAGRRHIKWRRAAPRQTGTARTVMHLATRPKTSTSPRDVRHQQIGCAADVTSVALGRTRTERALWSTIGSARNAEMNARTDGMKACRARLRRTECAASALTPVIRTGARSTSQHLAQARPTEFARTVLLDATRAHS